MNELGSYATERDRVYYGTAVAPDAPLNSQGRTPAEQAGEGLIRDHSKPVRQVLQRAGLSQQSELTATEVQRAEEAIIRFQDAATPSAKIRNYIMPPPAAEEDTDGDE